MICEIIFVFRDTLRNARKFYDEKCYFGYVKILGFIVDGNVLYYPIYFRIA